MDKISQNPKILRNILERFLLTNYRGATSCILVCKAWSDVGLDILWYKLRTRHFYYIFKILAPLKRAQKVGNSMYLYKFNRDLTAADWTRFGRYSHRVRVLELLPLNSFISTEKRTLDPSVYDVLALSRPTFGIFPNLTDLETDSRLSSVIPLFLSPGVKTLKVGLFYPRYEGEPEPPLNDRIDLLHHAALQLSGLHEISLYISPSPMGLTHWGFGYTIRAEEQMVVELLRQQSGLRVFSLPWSWFTSRIAEAVAFLPGLKKVCHDVTGADVGNPLDTLCFNPVLRSDVLGASPFPSIQNLSLNIPYPQFQRFLSNWIPLGHTHTQLNHLTIRSQVLESSLTMQGMLETLVPRCPNLTSLTLSSLCSSHQMPNENPLPYLQHKGQDQDVSMGDADEQANWTLERLYPFRIKLDTIRPLFAFQHLQSLKLHHHLPAAFSSSDLETLASNFTNLKHLDLFSDPHPIALDRMENDVPVGKTREVSFDEIVEDQVGHERKRIPELRQTLRIFGSTCPNLETLSIFVCPHRDNPITDEEFLSSPLETPYFPNLKTLSFGTSFCRRTMAGTISLVLGEYIHPRVRVSGKYESEDDDFDYEERLCKGGVIPNTRRRPPSPPSSQNQFGIEGTTGDMDMTPIDPVGNPNNPTEPTPNAWKYDSNGNPIPSDHAILVSPPRDLLVFDVAEFFQDTTMKGTLGGIFDANDGEKWMPGVAFTGRMNREIQVELKQRCLAWLAVAEFMPLVTTIKGQEMRRMERLLVD